MLFTTDGGDIWTPYQFTFETLNGLHFTDNDNGWAVGEGGTIIHTGNATIVDMNEFVKTDKTNLDISVYPNPFTTSITITYELVQSVSVHFYVYNQLGHLVHQHTENQQRGLQQLQWEAEDQPVGFYFYRLEITNQNATGKLVKTE
jgi:hypothetical protein